MSMMGEEILIIFGIHEEGNDIQNDDKFRKIYMKYLPRSSSTFWENDHIERNKGDSRYRHARIGV